MWCKNTGNPPDAGYSWVVLLSATTHFFMQACCYSGNGVYLVAFQEYFRDDMRTISWIVACQLTMIGLAAVAGGPLVRHWGGRPVAFTGCLCIATGYLLSSAAINIPYMYLTYGLITGIGYGFYSVSVPVVLQQYFKEKKSRAFGVMMSGIALGAFVWPLLSQFLVDIYTWRGAVIIQAGIHLQALISASLLRPISYYQTKLKEVKENVDDEQLRKDSMTSDGSQLAPEALWVSGNIDQITAAAENQQTQIHSDHCGPLGAKISKVIAISFGPLATPAFLCHFLGHYLIQIGHFGILAFLPVRGAWMGVSKQAGAFLPSILGLFSGVGRIMVGFVGDRLPSKRPLISGVSAVIVGVITACSVLVSTYALVAVFSALYGFIGSAYIAFLYVIVSDTLPGHMAPQGTGLVMLAVGLANLTGMPLTGFMIDVTGSAAIPFTMFGGALALGGLLHILGQASLNRQRKYEAVNNIEAAKTETNNLSSVDHVDEGT